MTIPLQSSIVYGPVESRRFGRSLGINLLPKDMKVCNFDCVYCQYDLPPPMRNAVFPTVGEVVSETASSLRDAILDHRPIDWITIAGNGEPTLHPNFLEIVVALVALRDRLLPDLPIGILSNSSTCHKPKVREALSKLNGRFMKLDAGQLSVFCGVNRPADTAGWNEMIGGLSSLRDIVLQSLFFTGAVRNVDADTVRNWAEAVGRIRPADVQIYTIDRPTRAEGLLPASRETLDAISDLLFEQTGIRGMVFGKEIN